MKLVITHQNLIIKHDQSLISMNYTFIDKKEGITNRHVKTAD